MPIPTVLLNKALYRDADTLLARVKVALTGCRSAGVQLGVGGEDRMEGDVKLSAWGLGVEASVALHLIPQEVRNWSRARALRKQEEAVRADAPPVYTHQVDPMLGRYTGAYWSDYELTLRLLHSDASARTGAREARLDFRRAILGERQWEIESTGTQAMFVFRPSEGEAYPVACTVEVHYIGWRRLPWAEQRRVWTFRNLHIPVVRDAGSSAPLHTSYDIDNVTFSLEADTSDADALRRLYEYVWQQRRRQLWEGGDPAWCPDRRDLPTYRQPHAKRKKT